MIDIGCGTGEVAAGIAKHGAEHVLGVDYATTAIEIANQKHYDVKILSFRRVHWTNLLQIMREMW